MADPVSVTPCVPDTTAASFDALTAIPSISELLQRSRDAHARSRQYRGQNDHSGKLLVPADYPKAEVEIATALRLRQQAHQQDPEHMDNAWVTDLLLNKGISHKQLVAFFETYPLPDDDKARNLNILNNA